MIDGPEDNRKRLEVPLVDQVTGASPKRGTKLRAMRFLLPIAVVCFWFLCVSAERRLDQNTPRGLWEAVTYGIVCLGSAVLWIVLMLPIVFRIAYRLLRIAYRWAYRPAAVAAIRGAMSAGEAAKAHARGLKQEAMGQQRSSKAPEEDDERKGKQESEGGT